MRIQRNITPDQTCKYALVRLDKLRELQFNAGDPDIFSVTDDPLKTLDSLGLLEYGKPNDPNECFVLKLKDQFAEPALAAYIRSVQNEMDRLYKSGQSDKADSLKEYAKDIEELRARANIHPNKHLPD